MGGLAVVESRATYKATLISFLLCLSDPNTQPRMGKFRLILQQKRSKYITIFLCSFDGSSTARRWPQVCSFID